LIKLFLDKSLVIKNPEALKALEFSTLESDRKGQKRVSEESLTVKRKYYFGLRQLKHPELVFQK